MPVIDSQLHANRYGTKWQSLDLATTVEIVVGAMDAVGVDAAVIDEYTALDADHRMQPYVQEDDGFWRPRRPFSHLAVSLYPDRFMFLGRVDPDDPQLTREVEKYASEPGFAGVRLQWGPRRVVWSDPRWESGGYGALFELAQQHRFPVFLVLAPRVDTLVPTPSGTPVCSLSSTTWAPSRASIGRHPTKAISRATRALIGCSILLRFLMWRSNGATSNDLPVRTTHSLMRNRISAASSPSLVPVASCGPRTRRKQ